MLANKLFIYGTYNVDLSQAFIFY